MGNVIGSPRRVLGGFRQELKDSEFKGLLFFAVIILVVGTAFYMAVEKWDPIEAFYFSVTTLTTVGFGDLHPTSDLSRLFTTAYVLVGVGFILGFVNVVARRAVDRVAKGRNGRSEE
jgi:voltage-gated potassium channel